MSLTRKLILALLALFLLLAGALTWLVASFDVNRYKGLAIDWVQQHRQRQLSLGDVRLSVFPRLQVELRDVALSEFQQPQQRFASLGEAELAVQWLPLLRGQLVVDAVSLDLVSGCMVDYVESLGGAAFKVENPQATEGCGCGSSFAI